RDRAGGGVKGAPRMVECRLLAMSGGWSPVVHLHAQSGARPRFDEARAAFVPGKPVQDERSVGGCNGTLALGEAIAEGMAGGTEAAWLAGFASESVAMPAVEG